MTHYPVVKTKLRLNSKRHHYLRLQGYTIFITLLFIIASISSDARDIRSDSDSPTDTTKTNVNPLTHSEQRKAVAMTAFARLFMKPSNEQSKKNLYTILANDPEAKMPLKIALFSLKKAANADELLTQMITIAEANPHALAINLAVIAYLYDKKQIDKAKSLAENCLMSDISPAKLSKQNLSLYANIIALRGLIYTKKQNFTHGEIFFDALAENKYLHRNFTVMKAAVLFFENGSKHCDRTPFLWFWASDYDRFKQKATATLTLMAKIAKNEQELGILATVYEKLDMPERAEAVLVDYLIKHNKNEPVILMLAKMLTRNKDNRALLYWDALVKINNNKLLYLFQAGNLAWLQGYRVAAIKYFNLYLKKRPDDRTVRLRLSMIYMAQGNFDQALIILQNRPPSFYILQGIGTIKLRSGDYNGAFASFKQAAKLLPTKKISLFFCMNMLIAANYNGDIGMVKKYVALIVLSFPNKVASYGNALGYTLADNNIELDLAEKLLQQALKDNPKKLEILDSMAWLLYRKKNYAAALSYIKLSLQACGKYPHAVIADHAGDIYMALNQRSKALKYWQSALTTFSTDLDRNAVLNKINKHKN